MCGPQAHQGKANQRLGAFGEPAQIVDAFVGEGGAFQAALRCQCGKGQEGGGGADEGGQQHGGGQGVALGLRHGKGQRDAGVEQEVECDVKETASVGGGGQSGQRAVDAVEKAADEQQHKADESVIQSNGQRRRHAHRKAHQRDVIGVHPNALQVARSQAQCGSQQGQHKAVKHGAPNQANATVARGQARLARHA